jgi:hypothetical protein
MDVIVDVRPKYSIEAYDSENQLASTDGRDC